MAARTGGGFPWQEVLGILFVAGAAVVLLWVVFSHLRVWSIVRSGRSERRTPRLSSRASTNTASAIAGTDSSRSRPACSSARW